MKGRVQVTKEPKYSPPALGGSVRRMSTVRLPIDIIANVHVCLSGCVWGGREIECVLRHVSNETSIAL